MDSRTCDEKRDILGGIRCGILTDATEEFIRSREHLSQGDLIFIYRNSEDKDVDTNLYEVSIRVHNQFTEDSLGLDAYIVEIYTEDYSVIYPHVPRTYLEVELFEILKNSKVPNDILITYKQIIEDLKV